MNRLIQIINGQDTRFSASLIRSLTRCAEPVYCAAVQWRNRSYDHNPEKITHAHCPVISIGNLTTGGTGKTPMVVHVIQTLKQLGATPAIILRGYKSTETGSDEAKLLAEQCEGVTVITNPNRVEAAQTIARKHPQVNVIILDDAFQHRRIARDLDIVLIDATNPFGYGHVLPRGLMREPAHNLKRADAVIITRSDQIDATQLARLDEQIKQYHDQPPIAHAIHQWSKIVDQNEQVIEPNHQNVITFCGIGNPDAFFDQASKHFQLIQQIPLDDHHNYDQIFIQNISQRINHLNPDALLTTDKDWVKLKPMVESGRLDIPVWRPKLTIGFSSCDDKLSQLLSSIVQPRH